MYSFYSGCRDKKTGKYAKKGKRYFEFLKQRKNSNGKYEIVKHKNISSTGIKIGRTVCKTLYYLQKPLVKAGLIVIAALGIGKGAWSLYKHGKKQNNTDSKLIENNNVNQSETKKLVTQIENTQETAANAGKGTETKIGEYSAVLVNIDFNTPSFNIEA